MKRSRNIFNAPILPQSLLQDDFNNSFRIAGRQIRSDWLCNCPQSQYLSLVYSALFLAEYYLRLQQLYEDSTPDNYFQIASLKTKMANLALIEYPQKIYKAIDQAKQIHCEGLLLQKISGFFNSSFLRKCKVHNKELFIESKKGNNYIPVEMNKFSISMEVEGEKKEAFKQFQWVEGYKERLLLETVNKKYCLYGSEEELKQFQKYFKKQVIKMQRVDVFEILNIKYVQKMFFIFGDKIRFYQLNQKIKRVMKDSEVKLILPSNEKFKSPILQPISVNQNPLSESSSFNQDQIVNLQSAISLQLDSPLKIKKKQELRIKPIEENQELNSMQYDIKDIQIGLGDDFGQSEGGDESHNSVDARNLHFQRNNMNINIFQVPSNYPTSNRTQEEKLSLSNIFYQNQLQSNESQQFLFQQEFVLERTQSLEQPLKIQNQNKQNKKPYLIKNFQKKQSNEIGYEQINRQKDIFIQICSLEMMMPYYTTIIECQVLQLDYEVQRDKHYVYCAKVQCQFSCAENEQAKKQVKSVISTSITKILSINPKTDPNTYEAILSTTMHPQPPSSAPSLSLHKPSSTPYVYYVNKVPPSKICRHSNQFVLVLKTDVKDHYLPFEMDADARYQQNTSQLLMNKFVKQDYLFACILHIHISPNPVYPVHALSTVQFMMKYLYDSEYTVKQEYIQEKKKYFLLREKWNMHMLDSIVEACDENAFERAVFRGVSDEVERKIVKDRNQQEYQQHILQFSDVELRLVEDNIVSSVIYDIRLFMKPRALICKIGTAVMNEPLKRRLRQVYAFMLLKKGNARNIAYLFVREVLSKIQQIIMLARKQEEVENIIDLYFQVEYQIDQLFAEIAKYYRKKR